MVFAYYLFYYRYQLKTYFQIEWLIIMSRRPPEGREFRRLINLLRAFVGSSSRTSLPLARLNAGSNPNKHLSPLIVAAVAAVSASVTINTAQANDQSPIDKELQRKLEFLRWGVDVISKESKITFEPTNNELNQLLRLIGNKYVTPEARSDNSTEIPFEMKRAMIRAMSWQLLCSGDAEQAYKIFTRGQSDHNKLSFDSFQKIMAVAKKLPAEVQTTQRSIAFLTISEQTRKLSEKLNIQLSTDSEQFLTTIVEPIISSPWIMPATADLEPQQREKLHIAFLKDTHLRHIMYTEGGANMLASLRAAIKNHNITREDFENYWVWRWRINLFGFQSGPGAKYYTETTHQLFEAVVSELLKLFDDPHSNPLPGYLNNRADMAGYQPHGPRSKGLASFISPNRLTDKQMELHKLFFGHLVAMCDITDEQQGRRVLTGLNQYLESAMNPSTLLLNYKNFIEQENVKTPTYTPAIYKSAELILREAGHKNSIELATKFLCQVLNSLHKLDLSERIYPCRDLAWKANLKPIIEHWLKHDQKLAFTPNEKFEITPDYLLTPKVGSGPTL